MTYRKEIIQGCDIWLGDCREVAPTLDYVDAIVCDPPYEISFMNQPWDKRGVAFDPSTWGAIGDCLKPGGFLLAFGGTRTYHRMTCAIEDAGFIIQDCIMWVYGQGFPKGKYMLKPAYEPIVVAYKPGDKRELQIEECRIPVDKATDASQLRTINRNRRDQDTSSQIWGFTKSKGDRPQVLKTEGRWPANLVHDGSDEVMTLFPETTSGSGNKNVSNRDNGITIGNGLGKGNGFGIGGDTGSASRFFYCAKASKQDRAGSKHPTVKPQALMRHLIQLVTPPGGTVLDPFAGSGATGQAALAVGRKAILIENEQQWFDDSCQRMRNAA